MLYGSLTNKEVTMKRTLVFILALLVLLAFIPNEVTATLDETVDCANTEALCPVVVVGEDAVYINFAEHPPSALSISVNDGEPVVLNRASTTAAWFATGVEIPVTGTLKVYAHGNTYTGYSFFDSAQGNPLADEVELSGKDSYVTVNPLSALNGSKQIVVGQQVPTNATLEYVLGIWPNDPSGDFGAQARLTDPTGGDQIMTHAPTVMGTAGAYFPQSPLNWQTLNDGELMDGWSNMYALVLALHSSPLGNYTINDVGTEVCFKRMPSGSTYGVYRGTDDQIYLYQAFNTPVEGDSEQGGTEVSGRDWFGSVATGAHVVAHTGTVSVTQTAFVGQDAMQVHWTSNASSAMNEVVWKLDFAESVGTRTVVPIHWSPNGLSGRNSHCVVPQGYTYVELSAKADQESYALGDTVTMTFTATVGGNMGAGGFTPLVEYPSNSLELTALSNGGFSVGDQITWDTRDLALGTSETYTATYTVTDVTAGSASIYMSGSMSTAGTVSSAFLNIGLERNPTYALDIDGPSQASVGEDVELAVAVQNTSVYFAHNVPVTYTATFTPQDGLVDRSIVTTTITQLLPSDGWVYIDPFTYVSVEEGDLHLEVVVGNTTATHTVEILPEEDALELTMSGPNTLIVGTTGMYSINVTNHGTATKEVTIDYTLIFTPTDPDGTDSFKSDGFTVAVEAGETVSQLVEYTATAPGTLQLQATIDGTDKSVIATTMIKKEEGFTLFLPVITR